jgi:hypothetical protein
MANNYYQATLTPDSIHLNDLHRAWLDLTGADWEKEKDGRYYVFWRECLNEDIEDQLNEAMADESITQEQADIIIKHGFNGMLLDILNYAPNSEVTHLRIDGAWTCSKMRPGNFGGAATIITRTQHCDMNTGSVFYNKDTGKIELRFCDIVDF